MKIVLCVALFLVLFSSSVFSKEIEVTINGTEASESGESLLVSTDKGEFYLRLPGDSHDPMYKIASLLDLLTDSKAVLLYDEDNGLNFIYGVKSKSRGDFVAHANQNQENKSATSKSVVENEKSKQIHQTDSRQSLLIATVKDGTLNIDGSTTVGNALDNYKYFRSTGWKEFEDQQRRRVVEFNGKIDAKSTIKKWLQSRYSEDVINKLTPKNISSDIDVNLQFLVNTDNETFKLAYGEVVLNGQIIGQDASHIIRDVYKNELINDINFGVGSIFSDEANKISRGIASKKLEEAKKKYLIDNRSKFVGKYKDAVSGEDGKCKLVVKDMDDSFVKIELTMKDTDKKPETYDLKFPIELKVDSIDQLTNNYYKIEGHVEKTNIPDAKEASISIFRESGGPLIVLHGLCRARFEKE